MLQKIKQTDTYQMLAKPASKRLWFFVLWMAFATAIFYLSFRFNDTDLYYILATGREILENGIPHTNPFITTPDCNVVVQNWLYCVIIAFIYNHLHTFGLWLLQLCFLVGMAAAIFCFFGVKRTDENKILVGVFCIILYSVFGYTNLRPQMFTFLLIMAELIALEKFRDTNKLRYLFVLPLVVLLEINGHASYWIMHYIVLLPYIVRMPKVFKIQNAGFSKIQCKTLSAFLVAMTGMLFVNPYGTKSITYVFTALSSKAVKACQIVEQQPVSMLSWYAFVVIVSILCFVFLCKRYWINSVSFFMYAGMLILMIMAVKWAPFFMISIMYLLRCCYNQIADYDGYSKVATAFVIMIISLIIVIVLLFFAEQQSKHVFDAKSDKYMDEWGVVRFDGYDKICDWLDEHDEDASVFAIFAYANYFEYRGYKVYYDARPEIYVKEVTGGAEPLLDALIVSNGFDQCSMLSDDGYTKDKHLTSKDDYDNMLTIVDKYMISEDEYSKTVDSIDTDYFVFENTDILLRFYIESNPEKYKLVMHTDNVFLYQRVDANPS